MKKLYFLFFTFFCGINMIWSQTDYGILFISSIDARYEMIQTAGEHNISGIGISLVLLPNESFTPISNIEDFSYAYADLSTKKIHFYFSSYHDGCYISENKDLDITNGNTQSFLGCFAGTICYLIHLNQPTDASRCIEQTIELNNGYNWQYSYNGTTWTDFPIEYQDKTSISFKIKTLTGYENKSKIFFRTGYKTNFTNTVIYDIIPCSPNLVGSPEIIKPSCFKGNDGQVTFTFDRDLIDNETFLLNLTQVVNGYNLPPKEKNVSKTEFINKKITFTGLESGNYFLHYETFQNNNTTPTSDNLSDVFFVDQPKALKYIINTTNPSCYGANGEIVVEASGGTPPYYYSINNATKTPFTNPFTSDANGFKGSQILTIQNGSYNIKITDKNDCIEK